MAIPLGPFDLIEPLGSGGMGAVWRGIHREQSIPVAIKALSGETADDSEFRDEFEREVQAVAGLAHPGIVTVYDYGTISEEAARASGGALLAGSPMLAMELADRGSLTNLNLVSGWSGLRDLLLQLLDALGYAHARGVIHRDVKPTNILLSSTDHGGVRYKLTDFGIAHALDPYNQPTTREEGIYRGSPDYSPPEQLEGAWRDFGPWTDLYAVGCVAYEFAAGRPPFVERDFVKLAIQHMDEQPPPIEPRFGVPDRFYGWLEKLLAKEPAERFQRAADAAWALIELSPTSTQWAAAEFPPDTVEMDIEPGEEHGRPDAVYSVADSGELTPGDTPHPQEPSLRTTRSEQDRFEQMATVEFPDRAGRAAGGATAVDGPGPAGSKKLSLPEDAWRQSERVRPASGPAGATSRPPFPPTWRRERPRKPDAHLIGAGLNLFGLREVDFVGREAQRDAIWERLSEVVESGGTQAVIIRGPSGTGKSRLAQWMCQRAHEVGAARVLSASHSPQAQSSQSLRRMLEQPLSAWGLKADEVHRRVCDAMEVLFELDAAQEEAYLLDYTARGVAEFMRPELADTEIAGPTVDFRSRRERHAVLGRFFKALSRERPLMVWLDDIPWGRDALGLVESMIHSDDDTPVLFVMTARDECLSRRPAVAERLDNLSEFDNVLDIELGPLPAPNHAELIEHLLTLSPALAWQLEERTAGNPLFAVQLVRDWVERDVLAPSPQGFVLREGADAPLPDDLSELCRERIERFLSQRYPTCTEEVRQVLEVAAALGRHIDRVEWRTACKNLGLKVPAGLVAEMVNHRLAHREQDGWAFVHGALREVVECGARKGDRWGYHQRNCIIMLDELYGLETPGVWKRWGDLLCRAGEFEEALEPLLAAANAARVADNCPGGIEVLDLIDDICRKLGLQEDVRQVRAWLQRAYLVRQYRHVHNRREARDLIERAMDLAGRRGWLRELGLALLEEARTLAHEGRFEEALGSFESARSIFEENGMQEESVTTLLSMSTAYRRVGQFHQMLQTLKQARRICPAHDERHRALVHERYTQYYLSGPQRDLEQAQVHAERFLRSAQDHLSPVNEAKASCNIGEIHRLMGRHDRALAEYRRAYALSSGVGAVKLPCVALHNIGMIEFARGDLRAARRWFRDSRMCMEKNDYRLWMAVPIIGMAACDALGGQWDSAASLLETALERLDGRTDYVRDLAVLAQALGEAAAEADRPALAEPALELARAQWQVLAPEA